LYLTSDLEEMNLMYYDYCLSKRSDGTFSFDEDALVFSGRENICFILTNALGKECRLLI
jgi:hypothetical protein